MRVVVGIAGQMRAGKDTIANYLVREHGFTRIAFADPLKEEVLARLRRTLVCIVRDLYDVGWLDEHGLVLPRSDDEAGMTALLRHLLWNDRPPVIRALLQEYGTEVRRADESDYWLRRWARAVIDSGAERVVAPDVRFANEANLIHSAAREWRITGWQTEADPWMGLVAGVTRPGMLAQSIASSHASEQGLGNFWRLDASFENDGSIADLERKVSGWITPILSADAHPATA